MSLKSPCCRGTIYIMEITGVGGIMFQVHACKRCGQPCLPMVDMPVKESEIVKAVDSSIVAAKAALALLETDHQARYPLERAIKMLEEKSDNPELKSITAFKYTVGTDVPDGEEGVVFLVQDGKMIGRIINIGDEG